MRSGPQKAGGHIAGRLRCRYLEFLYTPRHAELLHLRRKETLLLTARFAALFVLALLVFVPVWDHSFHADNIGSHTFILRLLVAGVALAVVTNYAVSSRWRRHLPFLPMVLLITAVSLLCLFSVDDPLATPRMYSAHSFMLLGLVVLIAIMPVTLLESLILSAPILALLLVSAWLPLETGFVPLEMLLAVLLPLAILSSLVQFYRTTMAAQEVAIDPLTGCYTRAFGTEMIRVTFDAAQRKNAPYTVAFIDLDDFKKINDLYGHDYGDRILGEVGANLCHRFRRSDLVIRWGGEEFLILLPEINRARARDVLTRVMAPGLANLENGQVQKASVGLSERIEDAISMPHNLIELADQRMYDAKKRRDHDDMIADGLAGIKHANGAQCAPHAETNPANQTIN